MGLNIDLFVGRPPAADPAGRRGPAAADSGMVLVQPGQLGGGKQRAVECLPERADAHEEPVQDDLDGKERADDLECCRFKVLAERNGGGCVDAASQCC